MIEIPVSRGTVRVEVSGGFMPVPTAEPGRWLFQSGDTAAEVRYRPGENEALEFAFQNGGSTEVRVPGFRFVVGGCAVGWLSGTVGRMLLDGAAWVMLSGWCADGGNGPEGRIARVFGDETGLAPGKRLWSRWRLYPDEAVPPLPAWVPAERYLPLGEAVEVPDPDVACTGQALSVETTMDGSLVRGPAGCHELVVHGPAGVSGLQVGWHLPMEQLVTQALERLGEDPGLEAWLLVWLLSQPGLDEREQLLDWLDLALGDCLECPGLWGVMAGLRAIQVTDLPVQDEVEAAVRGFNVEEALVMRTAIDGAALTSHPSSAHTGFTAREVVLTRVQLAGHPESPLHQELAEGLRVAEARLCCELSTAPDPAAIAWLLLGSSLG